MSLDRSIRRRKNSSEEGYILVGVMILLAVFVIAMAVTAPKIAAEIQRDREVETMHRGKQYIRAIQLYYRKFNAYPPNMDALVKTNEIRFLRKRYIDPMTGKDDWKPILFGQNKAPLAMGFFGEPLGGTGGAVLGGIGPGGGNGLNGGSGMQGGSSFGGGGAMNPTGGLSNPSGGMFNNPGSPAGPTGPGGPAGGLGGVGDPSGPTTPGGTTGGGTDTTGNPGTGGTGTDPTQGGQATGPTFGGGGIIGFSPGSEKQSILVYKKKNHLNEWEFTYSPLMDQPMISGGNSGTIGLPMGGQGGINGPQTGTGFGPGSGGGTPPITPTPTPPTTPQSPVQQ